MSETNMQLGSGTRMDIRQMAVIALMTAVTCVIAPFSLPIGPVPVSLGSFAIYLSVCVLGWKRATISCLIYLLLGLVGVPVFTGWQAGPAKVFGPTGGYLLGYLMVTVAAGLLMELFRHKLWGDIIALILGTALLYGAGSLWLAYQAHMTFMEALWEGVILFIPGDLIKMAAAVLVGSQIRRQLNRTAE